MPTIDERPGALTCVPWPDVIGGSIWRFTDADVRWMCAFGLLVTAALGSVLGPLIALAGRVRRKARPDEAAASSSLDALVLGQLWMIPLYLPLGWEFVRTFDLW